MKRIFDFSLALFLSFVFLVPFILIALIVKITSKGPALHWSKRVGKGNSIFLMPKFRSMYINTPQLATHLLSEQSQNFITPIGSFLRKTSLDEIPQLISILKGDMSFVGPRPALYNQDDLVEQRTKLGVDNLVPGLTGWAQINGRDEIPIPQKVQLDKYYLDHQGFFFDIKIMVLTFFKVLLKSDVQH